MMTLLLMYVLVGAIAGIMAGLLGIGGGLVIVPMLVFCFTRQGVSSDVIMPCSTCGLTSMFSEERVQSVPVLSKSAA